MKWRFIKTKAKEKPWNLIRDPNDENKKIGSYKSLKIAQSKHRDILKGK